jgi:hypothetical protein
MWTWLTVLVTWGLTSTLVSGVTMPEALSNTGKSRFCARTVVTVTGAPGADAALAGALLGPVGAATSVLPEQAKSDAAASPQRMCEVSRDTFMVTLCPGRKMQSLREA